MVNISFYWSKVPVHCEFSWSQIWLYLYRHQIPSYLFIAGAILLSTTRKTRTQNADAPSRKVNKCWIILISFPWKDNFFHVQRHFLYTHFQFLELVVPITKLVILYAITIRYGISSFYFCTVCILYFRISQGPAPKPVSKAPGSAKSADTKAKVSILCTKVLLLLFAIYQIVQRSKDVSRFTQVLSRFARLRMRGTD